MSEMVPLVPLGMRNGLRNMFDMCPLNKIMYGSDGYVIPEIHWLGAKTAKYELGLLFTELVRDHYFDESLALETAKDILFNTAKDLYGLD